MDYISYTHTPLSAEQWYHRQYGRVEEGVIPGDTPRMEVSVVRYLLTAFARGRAEEYTRQHTMGLGQLERLEPSHGFDEVYASKGTYGMSLVLRQGGTLLYAEYVGEKDLLDYLDRFAQMFAQL